jgi:hypothetical protein
MEYMVFHVLHDKSHVFPLQGCLPLNHMFQKNWNTKLGDMTNLMWGQRTITLYIIGRIMPPLWNSSHGEFNVSVWLFYKLKLVPIALFTFFVWFVQLARLGEVLWRMSFHQSLLGPLERSSYFNMQSLRVVFKVYVVGFVFSTLIQRLKNLTLIWFDKLGPNMSCMHTKTI